MVTHPTVLMLLIHSSFPGSEMTHLKAKWSVAESLQSQREDKSPSGDAGCLVVALEGPELMASSRTLSVHEESLDVEHRLPVGILSMSRSCTSLPCWSPPVHQLIHLDVC